MPTFRAAATSLALLALAGCSTPQMQPPPPPVAPPPLAGAAAEKVGAGSKPGFCTFKGPNGTLFEKKC